MPRTKNDETNPTQFLGPGWPSRRPATSLAVLYLGWRVPRGVVNETNQANDSGHRHERRCRAGENWKDLAGVVQGPGRCQREEDGASRDRHLSLRATQNRWL